MDFGFFCPTRILFGAGRLNDLHKQALPGRKALVVISNGRSTKASGYLSRTVNQLQNAGVATVIFDRIEANPLKSTVMAGASFARENGCDFIVALGGGSVMDASKAISFMATNDGDYWDYVPAGTGKGLPLKHKPLPVVAITTTAGTGSEADPWGVITNEETHEKIGFGTDDSFPVLAIVDPELMVTVPPRFTAYQGFDALFHSVESYLSGQANLMSDMLALTAVEHVTAALPSAVEHGDDLEARTRVAFGQYPFGYRDARQRNNESALSRTCHVGLPSGFAARGGTDNDKPGILFPFHRKARLRRPFRTVGASHGHDRNIGSGGFHYGAYEPAACMWSRWPADVGLRYQTGRVSEDGLQCLRYDGRTVRQRPFGAQYRRLRRHL